MMLERNVRTFWLLFDEIDVLSWWLIYRLVCNHFGWNETSVLGVERKPRYHGYICLYMLQYDEIDVLCWWLIYRLVCNHFGWNETSVLRVERKPRYHGYICLYMLQYDEINVLCWWLIYRLVCNHFGWNETSVLGVKRKSRYRDYTCTYKLQIGWIWLLLWLNDECICNHLIEMKSEYWRLKGNQGTVIADGSLWGYEFGIKYESLWLNVKLSFIRLKNSYLHL